LTEEHRVATSRHVTGRIRALARAGLDALLAEPRADASRVGAIG
jgi:hypothetical protein